jgi:hypothetical protein
VTPDLQAAQRPGNPNVPVISIHSPHGNWDIAISLYPGDFLPASDMAGHAMRQLVPLGQQEFTWYLTENGRRLSDDENVYANRDRTFNLVMEMP